MRVSLKQVFFAASVFSVYLAAVFGMYGGLRGWVSTVVLSTFSWLSAPAVFAVSTHGSGPLKLFCDGALPACIGATVAGAWAISILLFEWNEGSIEEMAKTIQVVLHVLAVLGGLASMIAKSPRVDG